MLTRGEYKTEEDHFGIILKQENNEVEIILTNYANTVVSAFRKRGVQECSYNNKKAKEVYGYIKKGMTGCTAKNCAPAPCQLGVCNRHVFTKSKVDYTVLKFQSEFIGCEIRNEKYYIYMEYCDIDIIPKDIPYIELTNVDNFVRGESSEDNITVRSLAEISLEKDTTWIKNRNKKYYIVNDEKIAEQIFSYLDNYTGPISYDTETTGLKINMFSKINSKEQKLLEEYNKSLPKEEQIRADRLVGIIFSIEENVSYYFPVFNRKYKNLYEYMKNGSKTYDGKGELKGLSDEQLTELNKERTNLANAIKSKYTIGEFRDVDSDIAKYFRDTPIDEITPDTILMERVRKILEHGKLVAHNGSFEWKVSWCYNIDINLADDTMILHQLMHKFRSTTANRGEPSNLKYLSKKEFGIDQLDLKDFFPEYEEDSKGTVKGTKGKKKKGRNIDFSYMDYEGSRAYAPADGDLTLGLLFKYKRDLLVDHPELEYLYGVELIVSCAIGYMEFYGHRLDENKVNRVREDSRINLIEIEHKIRKLGNLSDNIEDSEYDKFVSIKNKIAELNNNLDILKTEQDEFTADKIEGVKKEKESLFVELESISVGLKDYMDNKSENKLNLAAPQQVGKLFFETLGITSVSGSNSVAKKELKPLLKMKNEDGTDKYPIVHLYSEWKKIDTLMTKFFDNLPDFMYPGGFIFSSYGQISTATGRMSCSRPNAQQYPKNVTDIVVPREGYVMADADYSQIEYRTLVAMAKETHLAELFKDPDNDYHTLMASLMYGVPYASVSPKMRGDAKSFNFGIPYGMGFKSLAILLTGMSGPAQVAEAKEKYELYFKDQPNVRKFFDDVKEMANINRYTKTFWNRYRYYSFTDKDGNFSQKKKASALRQAGNAVIQGSAADIFKISVARNFNYIRKNKLLGLLLIVNMIHDEQLFEINVERLNTQAILRDLIYNMQFRVEGFPPLYVGAGFGKSWAKAKGKMAEIHPHLADQLCEEAKGMSVWSDYPVTDKEILKYYDDRVYQFRLNKVKEYITNTDNHHKDLHPAIGNLINLQFNYNIEKGDLSDEDYTKECLKAFIKNNGLNTKAEWFKNTNIIKNDTEDEEGYDDSEELDDLDIDIVESSFTLIDESDKLYGTSLHDIISEWGLLVSKNLHVCGIDSRRLPYKRLDELVEFLVQHECEQNDDDAMQIVFLNNNNVLFNTGIWVNNIEGSDISKKFNLKWSMYN